MKYFVEHLPSSCFYCDCCHTENFDCRYKIDGDKVCGIENMNVNDFYDYESLRRPDWCPLREIKISTDFIKQFNNNKVTEEFLESCKKAAKLFKKEGSNEKSN